MAEKRSLKRKWIQKLRNKYLLVIRNEDTYEVKLSFRLSRLNVFIALGLTAIILVVLTIFLIAFTPLREYIPGYMDVDMPRQMYALQLRADSIEREFRQRSLYFENLKNIIEGNDMTEFYQKATANAGETDTAINYSEIQISHSREDSLLRLEFERQGRYLAGSSEGLLPADEGNEMPDFLFFTPLNGIITSRFNPDIGHFGVDLVSNKNEPIKAILDGMVIFAGWTLETGHVITIQHQQNILSVYKHNSVLLKKEGNFVKAGDVIAIIGESGELSTGPHLHLELWYNGNPVDPTDYIRF
ncbi:MAG: M23 family metallopeptidase [Bacteroidales bacterium]|nr:M23 family metallopeptidase [Bacteroidales bacterium]